MTMLTTMLSELLEGLLRIFSKEAVQIILYGSVARGMDQKDSDIDIALFVNKSLSSEQEDALSDLMVDLNLKYDRVFSVIDIDATTYERWKQFSPFYRNVEKDGIVLWKAA